MSSTPKRYSAAQSSPTRDNVSSSGQRPKRPPPITPRRFKRFFTPRVVQSTVRTSRKALRDITVPSLNRASHKRKISVLSTELDLQSSPIKRVAFFPNSSQGDDPDYDIENKSGIPSSTSKLPFEACQDSRETSDDEDIGSLRHSLVPPIRRFPALSTSANLLSSRLSGGRLSSKAGGSSLWQHEAAAFYSASTDVHLCNSQVGPHMTLPFCTASCNTNSLVAVGDEEGGIRLLDSATNDRDGYSNAYLCMKPHDNAIMDLTFSSDDALLATASGDQTSRIMDMQTQQSLYCLSGHKSSIKRVQFQSCSGNNIVATCSRDGNVNLWDLRCPGSDSPVLHLPSNNRWNSNEPILRADRSFVAAMAENMERQPVPDDDPKTVRPTMRYASVFNTIRSAHGGIRLGLKSQTKTKIEQARGREEVSVTSLAFLRGGREHMFVTASEADATVKLWDMRNAYNTRLAQSFPVSSTKQPSNHQRHRRFGLTSLVFSGDGARLYTLCRDHTVYTYSTSHLVLGQAPELSKADTHQRRSGVPACEGLGPLYGFRHPNLKVSTFYLRLSVRKTCHDRSELLAVGSSDNCAIVFPTSERYLTKSTRRQHAASESCVENDYPLALRRDMSSVGVSGFKGEGDATIYYHGTPLVRGHQKEVTAVSWTSEGGLATVSDDFSARCWRENAGEAEKLRNGGEGEGRRWMSGWADSDIHSFDDE